MASFKTQTLLGKSRSHRYQIRTTKLLVIALQVYENFELQFKFTSCQSNSEIPIENGSIFTTRNFFNETENLNFSRGIF